MKTKLLFAVLALPLFFLGCIHNQLDEPIGEGALCGSFSIGKTQKVHFSQGNLQYRRSTNEWRFAEHQYDIVGQDNEYITSSDYDGWIDLFGWGTSGWQSGAVGYQPYWNSQKSSDYYPDNNPTNDLTGYYANSDWGVYNTIINGGNKANSWRTLTYHEWNYLLNERPNASNLKGLAIVNGVTGYVLLPDNWIAPNGLSFINANKSYDDNVYTEVEWNQMEAHGAVFLPSAGFRSGRFMTAVGGVGLYWTATHKSEDCAFCFRIDGDTHATMYEADRYFGLSVRLIKDF